MLWMSDQRDTHFLYTRRCQKMTEEVAKSPETVASVAENLFRAAQGL